MFPYNYSDHQCNTSVLKISLWNLLCSFYFYPYSSSFVRFDFIAFATNILVGLSKYSSLVHFHRCSAITRRWIGLICQSLSFWIHGLLLVLGLYRCLPLSRRPSGCLFRCRCLWAQNGLSWPIILTGRNGMRSSFCSLGLPWIHVFYA